LTKEIKVSCRVPSLWFGYVKSLSGCGATPEIKKHAIMPEGPLSNKSIAVDLSDSALGNYAKRQLHIAFGMWAQINK